MLFNRLLISVVALAAVAIPASANPTIYCNNGCGANDETAFNNATALMGLIFGSGFESVTPNGTYSSGLLDADSTAGLDFFGYDDNNTTQDGVIVSGGDLDQTASGQGTALQVQFPANLVYAFGATVTVASGTATPCIEAISSISSFDNGNCYGPLAISGSSDTEFFGVVSSSPLTSVFLGTLNGNSGSLQINAIELGEQPAPTPEAATLVMIGSGLIVMRFLKRRANYKSAAAASSRNQVAAPPLRVASCAG